MRKHEKLRNRLDRHLDGPDFQLTTREAMLRASDIKRIFREHGLTPKKWMGQNLLVSRSYLNRIVEAAQVGPGEAIVEVGAGLGVLTEGLAQSGALVWALELDSGFFRLLEDKFAGVPNVELIHADALKYDFRALAATLGKLRVVANLPYNISSRLVFRFIDNRDIFDSLCILLQREVAERLAAGPGTRDYGSLTAILGVFGEARLLFNIPGKAFFPVPDVTSTLIRISFSHPPPVPVSDEKLLIQLVKTSFAGRRKTLRNTLKKGVKPDVSPEMVTRAAEEAAIDLSRRAETLTPQEFGRFADAIHRMRL